MKWSVVNYVEALSTMRTRCTGMQSHIENRLQDLFPLERSESIAEPCVVVDSEGIILFWFLPGLLNLLLNWKRQVRKKIGEIHHYS